MPSPSSGATTAGGERPRYEVADIVRAYGDDDSAKASVDRDSASG